LFDERIARDLDGMEKLIRNRFTIQDYRGYPIQLRISNFKNFPLSDEILKMKNVQFYFYNQSKPIHKLVSPAPHFVEEERNLIENHFKYLGSSSKTDDIEDWKCFEICEGHLVSMKSGNFQLTNESIEHLSNFPHLSNLCTSFRLLGDNITNFSLLSNLRKISLSFGRSFVDPEFCKDLGLFSNLLSLNLYCDKYSSGIIIICKKS